MEKNLKNVEELAEDEATKARREFLKKAGKFGITAPMAALLLSVTGKKASAAYNGANGSGMSKNP